MSVDITTLRSDLKAIEGQVDYLLSCLDTGSALSYWGSMYLWWGSLKLRTSLDTAIKNLEATPAVSAEQAATLLADALAFESKMQRSFDLIGRKKPEADALGVSNYVKPFVLELADRGRRWSTALQRIAPEESKAPVAAFSERLEAGFARAVEAYT